MGVMKGIFEELKERMTSMVAYDIGDCTLGLLDDKKAMQELEELLMEREDIVLWVIQQDYLSYTLGIENYVYELIGHRYLSNNPIYSFATAYDYDFDDDVVERFEMPRTYLEALSYHFIARNSKQDGSLYWDCVEYLRKCGRNRLLEEAIERGSIWLR